jgi:hypothetical protein
MSLVKYVTAMSRCLDETTKVIAMSALFIHYVPALCSRFLVLQLMMTTQVFKTFVSAPISRASYG